MDISAWQVSAGTEGGEARVAASLSSEMGLRTLGATAMLGPGTVTKRTERGLRILGAAVLGTGAATNRPEEREGLQTLEPAISEPGAATKCPAEEEGLRTMAAAVLGLGVEVM